MSGFSELILGHRIKALDVAIAAGALLYALALFAREVKR